MDSNLDRQSGAPLLWSAMAGAASITMVLVMLLSPSPSQPAIAPFMRPAIYVLTALSVAAVVRLVIRRKTGQSHREPLAPSALVGSCVGLVFGVLLMLASTGLEIAVIGAIVMAGCIYAIAMSFRESAVKSG